MPKYKVIATEYVFKDALIEAKDAEEACEKAQADNVDWAIVGGDFEIHEDMTFEEDDQDWFLSEVPYEKYFEGKNDSPD